MAIAKRQRRDIYKGRFDTGFDINRDIDLAHLRSIMMTDDVSNEDYNYYGLYIKNIIKIMLNSSHFRGYDESVKEDLEAEATIDLLKARRKFDANKYPQPTAPFNYLFRIGYHSFQHVLANYYQMRCRMVPASQVGRGATVLDSSDEFNEDVLDKAVTNWDAIADNLAFT
jgi:DNA-directed RNA polymerase specialized sigma24 family protein